MPEEIDSYPYESLREYVETLEEHGQLRRIDESLSLDLEVGHVAKLNEQKHGPALLFENATGFEDDPDRQGGAYEEDRPVLTSGLSEHERLALAMGFTPDTEITEVIKTWAERTSGEPMPPEWVDDAGCQDNVITEDINAYDIPSPRIYPDDGGPYIGTACYWITEDPETGEVNLGTYRGMIDHERNDIVSFQPIAGKDLHQALDVYKERDEKMPIAMVPGGDPVLFLCGSTLFGEEEYDMAGTLRQEPVKVTEGVEVDLPIPASAEWVLEGYVPPHDLRPEGPFGEYTGHHSKLESPKPYIEMEALTHRDDPIQHTCTVGPPITDIHQIQSMNRSATMWQQLEAMNIKGLESVYYHPGSTGRFICVASIDTKQHGHSTQVGTAMVSTKTGEYGLKMAIVVDDDVNPANIEEVLWALSVRMRPEKDVQILERGRNTPLDPSYASSERDVLGAAFTGRLVIDATVPYEWPEDEYPGVTEMDEDIVEDLESRWEDLFADDVVEGAGAEPPAAEVDDD